LNVFGHCGHGKRYEAGVGEIGADDDAGEIGATGDGEESVVTDNCGEMEDVCEEGESVEEGVAEFIGLDNPKWVLVSDGLELTLCCGDEGDTGR
jgi:hypothetical protein